MSHELTIREDGYVEHAYVGEIGWHGLGNELKPGATIEEWKKAAGMDWKAECGTVRFATTRGDDDDDFAGMAMKIWDDRVVLFRNDTLAPLGIVSSAYKPVQPGEVLEFFRDLTEAAGFQLETAGTLFGGRQLWALAKTNADDVIADKRDRVQQYALLSTSLDGSLATEAAYIATRVVCRNTLAMSKEEGGRLRVRVTHRSAFKPECVKKELGIESAQSAFESTIARMKALSALRVSNETVVSATARLFRPDFATLEPAAQSKVLDSFPVQTIGQLAIDGKAIGSDFDGVKGTAWGWLNAVTEFVDHHARTRGDNSDDNRVSSAWFGKGSDIKTKAFDMAGSLGSMQELIDSLNHNKVAA